MYIYIMKFKMCEQVKSFTKKEEKPLNEEAALVSAEVQPTKTIQFTILTFLETTASSTLH